MYNVTLLFPLIVLLNSFQVWCTIKPTGIPFLRIRYIFIMLSLSILEVETLGSVK